MYRTENNRKEWSAQPWSAHRKSAKNKLYIYDLKKRYFSVQSIFKQHNLNQLQFFINKKSHALMEQCFKILLRKYGIKS